MLQVSTAAEDKKSGDPTHAHLDPGRKTKHTLDFKYKEFPLKLK